MKFGTDIYRVSGLCWECFQGQRSKIKIIVSLHLGLLVTVYSWAAQLSVHLVPDYLCGTPTPTLGLENLGLRLQH